MNTCSVLTKCRHYALLYFKILSSYRKYRLEKQIKSMSWKIIFSDIEPIAHGNTFGSIKVNFEAS